MVDFAPGSDLGLHPSSSHSATIQRDSTATSGGKRWSIRSEHGSPSQGSLKFTNESDSGTPMIRFTPAGSIYAAEYLGVKKITSTPTDSQGEIGAMVLEFDATYKRLWVKTNTDGNNKNW